MKIGFTELILVAIVAFVVIGPDKLPEYARKLCKTNFHSVPIPFLSHNRHPLRPAVLLLHRGYGAVCAFVALCIPEVCELQMNLF